MPCCGNNFSAVATAITRDGTQCVSLLNAQLLPNGGLQLRFMTGAQCTKKYLQKVLHITTLEQYNATGKSAKVCGSDSLIHCAKIVALVRALKAVDNPYYSIVNV